MNNALFVFCFGGGVITVIVGLIVYVVCDTIACIRDNDFAIWPGVVAFFLSIVVGVMWCVFASPYFEPICCNGHRNSMTADYCIVCGVDLQPSCVCGHVWVDEEFCPDCGRAYEK